MIILKVIQYVRNGKIVTYLKEATLKNDEKKRDNIKKYKK